ncbi:hypothetical protein [Endozoicomonas sp. ONNA2]|uniref:hypothetical protein n=1 Tax=Endozoicomonas sp. ONNA2 TaxID=2828741 RepID=UPI002148785E|nr:hypothetical protein [Endozoicomonas sp. ONNA2]
MANSYPMQRFEQAFTPEQQRGIKDVLGGPISGSTWLAYRLADLKNYKIHFIIDNSISMNERDGMVNPETGTRMSRLQEATYRLENVADLLAYIPVKGINIQSFSKKFPPIDIRGTPAETSAQIKRCLREIGSVGNRHNSTPLFRDMREIIRESERSVQSPPSIIYVFNDGEPNDGGTKEDIYQLLKDRKAERSPVCLVACTSTPSAIEWMDEADEQPNVHVVDDFESERQQVWEHQGETFPFTEGFYLMSTLLGPIDPLFDKADENHIFDLADYQEICGRKIPPEEYELYKQEAERLQGKYYGCSIL